MRNLSKTFSPSTLATISKLIAKSLKMDGALKVYETCSLSIFPSFRENSLIFISSDVT